MNIEIEPGQGILGGPEPHLARHFLLIAEYANGLGDEQLGCHFLEIAMELFDAALPATSESAIRHS